jgi:outer membrane cobalamin receptor
MYSFDKQKNNLVNRCMKKFTWLILHFFCLAVSAETYTVKGKITDSESGQVIAGVLVHSEKNGTTSDVNGYYMLTVEQADIVMEFQLLGYEKQISRLHLTAVETVLNISLKPQNTNLDEVVVTASKYEQKISEITTSLDVLKPKLIESSGQTSMENAIEQVSGVNVVKSQVNIRGGSGFSYGAGSRVMLLVDDLPLLSPDAADIKWDFLPLENIGQVEVIKGASSALFGSSALGGVINLRTSFPKDKPETKIRVFAGMFDKYEISGFDYNFTDKPIFNEGLFFSHSRKIKNHDIIISGALVNDKEYREGELLRYARLSGNYKYHFKKVNGLAAGVNFNAHKQYRQNFIIWRSDTFPLIPADSTLNLTNNYRFYFDPYITYISPSGHKHSFRNRYYLTSNRGVDSKQNDYFSDLIYNEYQYQKSFGDTSGNELKFTIGASNMYSRIRSDTLYGNKSSDNAAAYLQADYRVKRIILSLGTRAEYFRTDTLEKRFIKVLRAGINYHVFKATFLRASIGEGYRMPSIAELYAHTNTGDLKISPNPLLQPESGWGAEVGIKQGLQFRSFKGMVDLAVFRTEYKNMIEYIFDYIGPQPFPPPDFFNAPFLKYFGFAAKNITNAQITGAEITLASEYSFRQWTATLAGGYTWIEPLNKDSIKAVVPDNKYLKYRYSKLLRVNADISYKEFSLGGTLRYNSFMTNIDEAFNTFIAGVKPYRAKHHSGDMIIDLRASWKINKNNQLAFIVKNAGNHEYMAVVANLGPPRYYMIQYSYSF